MLRRADRVRASAAPYAADTFLATYGRKPACIELLIGGVAGHVVGGLIMLVVRRFRSSTTGSITHAVATGVVLARHAKAWNARSSFANVSLTMIFVQRPTCTLPG